uniref:Peptidase_M16 domain-containing protein n=2 Tax=Heterorhabditis bacteriophora TaxID=37862 RepID=A0A1I7WAD5_HETBA
MKGVLFYDFLQVVETVSTEQYGRQLIDLLDVMEQKGPFTGQRSRKYSANHFELRLGSSSARGVFTGLSAFGLPFIPVDAELSSRTVLLRCG